MAAPATSIPESASSMNEADLMDFAAALAITLPKNENISKMTVYINSSGEPSEGYIGKPLVQHCREWMTLKTFDEIIGKLQSLMDLGILICAATQCTEKEWAIYQNSDEYLYGFNQSKINFYKCPSKGSDYVDKDRWNKQYKNEDVQQSLTKNSKINKGGIISLSYAAPMEITFTMTANAAKSGGKTESVTSNKIIKVREKSRDFTEFPLTKSQIEYRLHTMKEEQSKINQSMKNKGKLEWSWKTNEKEKKKAAYEKYKKEKAEKEKKERAKRSKMGGIGGVQTKYAHFDKNEDEKMNESPTKATNSVISYEDISYPIGSDDVKYYEKGMIVNIWNEGKKQWIDGEVLEVIKFVKTIKIKSDGKTQSFRLPNVQMVRLKH